jgi:hypothetical protein
VPEAAYRGEQNANVSHDILPFLAHTNNSFGEDWRRRSISSQRASVDSYGYVSSSPILVTLMVEVLRSSETSVLTRATQRNIT